MSTWIHRFGRRSNCSRLHAINIRRASTYMAKPQLSTIYCCCNKVNGNISKIRVIINLVLAIVMSSVARASTMLLLLQRQHQYIRIHVALRVEMRQGARPRRRNLARQLRRRRRRRRRRWQPLKQLPAFNSNSSSITIDQMRCPSRSQLLNNPPQPPHSKRTYLRRFFTKNRSICITSEVAAQVLVVLEVAVWAHPSGLSYWAMALSIQSLVLVVNDVGVSSVKVQGSCHKLGSATRPVFAVPKPSSTMPRACAVSRRSSITALAIKIWNATTAIVPFAWMTLVRVCPTNVPNGGAGLEHFPWFCHVFGVIGRCVAVLQFARNATLDMPAMAAGVKPLARRAACYRLSISVAVGQEERTPPLVALSHRELVEEFIAVLAEAAIILIMAEAVEAVTLVAVISVLPGYFESATSRLRKDCSTQVLNTNFKFYNNICSVK